MGLAQADVPAHATTVLRAAFIAASERLSFVDSWPMPGWRLGLEVGAGARMRVRAGPRLVRVRVGVGG